MSAKSAEADSPQVEWYTINMPIAAEEQTPMGPIITFEANEDTIQRFYGHAACICRETPCCLSPDHITLSIVRMTQLKNKPCWRLKFKKCPLREEDPLSEKGDGLFMPRDDEGNETFVTRDGVEVNNFFIFASMVDPESFQDLKKDLTKDIPNCQTQ